MKKLSLKEYNDCEILAGDNQILITTMESYSELACDFLNDLSLLLRNDSEADMYPDVKTFSFWCRRGNLKRLENAFCDGKIHRGRGLVYHIAPSNVPVNFAFTFAFGLLSGNANVVRVPSESYKQVRIICGVIQSLLMQKKYKKLQERNMILSYPRESKLTSVISACCDIRVIWGGDNTVQAIRQYEIKPGTIELVFPDRYSFGVIEGKRICDSTEKDIKRLAGQFYNDTFLMDQNACSAPHLLFITKKGVSGEQLSRAMTCFWDELYQLVEEKYVMEDIKVSDKYVNLCRAAVEQTGNIQLIKLNNLIYVLKLSKLPESITKLRGQFGMFYTYQIESLDEIVPYVEEKIQSMAYYGFDREVLTSFVKNNEMNGIDRIIPFGNTMDIGVFWDGYDIIGNLSKIVDII